MVSTEFETGLSFSLVREKGFSMYMTYIVIKKEYFSAVGFVQTKAHILKDHTLVCSIVLKSHNSGKYISFWDISNF